MVLLGKSVLFAKKDLDIAPAFVIIAEDKKTTATIYAECKKTADPC